MLPIQECLWKPLSAYFDRKLNEIYVLLFQHSIPTPKGGKHVVRPITVADQPMPKQHASKLSKTKNNPLDPDYIAGKALGIISSIVEDF